MITRKSLIFGISELIKVMPEEGVPADLYREIYSLAYRNDSKEDRIARVVFVLRKTLEDFDTPLSCPKCENVLPQCEVCLFCGHYFSAQKFDAESSNLKPYKPFKEGSQREIIERCFRAGTAPEEIVKQVQAQYPGVAESTAVNNMYIYISTWRKQYGWEIVRENGIIKLVDTHGNG
jgi:hypothetical protein